MASARHREQTFDQGSLIRALGGKTIQTDLYATPTFLCAPLRVSARHGPHYMLDLQVSRRRNRAVFAATATSAAIFAATLLFGFIL